MTTTILLILHLFIALMLIGVVLLQRSEGGALGIGGGPGSFMSGRSAANVLSKATTFIAAGFFLTSIALTVLARQGDDGASVLDRLPAEEGGASAPRTLDEGIRSLIDDVPAAEPAATDDAEDKAADESGEPATDDAAAEDEDEDPPAGDGGTQGDPGLQRREG